MDGTKRFPITWGGTSELAQMWKGFGRTKTPEEQAGNDPKQQNSPVELRGQFPYLNLVLNLFMIIVWNFAESSSIATLCSSLQMVFFWKWQNSLKSIWALLWSRTGLGCCGVSGTRSGKELLTLTEIRELWEHSLIFVSRPHNHGEG